MKPDANEPFIYKTDCGRLLNCGIVYFAIHLLKFNLIENVG
jgi:hypothetical protein